MLTKGLTGKMTFYLDAYKTPIDGATKDLQAFKTITTRLYDQNTDKLLLVAPIQESVNFSANINWETGPSSILQSFISGFSSASDMLRNIVGDGAETFGYLKKLLTGEGLSKDTRDKLNSELSKITVNQYDARKKFAGSTIEPPALNMNAWIVDDGTEPDYVITVLDNLTKIFLGEITQGEGKLSELIGYESAPNNFEYIKEGSTFDSDIKGTFKLQIGEFIEIKNLVVTNYSINLQTVNAFDSNPLMANVSVSLSPGKKFFKSDMSKWYKGS